MKSQTKCQDDGTFLIGVLVVSLLLWVILSGCAGVVSMKPLNPFEPPPVDATGKSLCMIYEDNGITGGLIYTEVRNPCAAQNILILIAQGGYSFEAYQFDEFNTWMERVKVAIQGGVSYTGLRAIILKTVMQQNKKMGLLLFSASGLIDMFQGEALLHPDDVKLTIMSINDIIAKVRALTIFD